MKKKEYKKRIEKEKKAMRGFNLNNENTNIKSVLIISICVIAFVFIMYAFTMVKTGEWNLFTRENDIVYSAEVQTTKLLCGQVMNRDDSEYFVLAYNLKEDSASLYDSILENYNNASRAIPLYKLDLSNSRNTNCIADTFVLSNNIKELKFSYPTLIKVKDGKITESYTDYERIKSVLVSYVD